jgi:hypothetical protein
MTVHFNKHILTELFNSNSEKKLNNVILHIFCFHYCRIANDILQCNPVTIRTARFNIQVFCFFPPHSVFMCFVWAPAHQLRFKTLPPPPRSNYLNGRLSWSQTRCRRFGEYKNFMPLLGIEALCWTRSAVTVRTALGGLHQSSVAHTCSTA